MIETNLFLWGLFQAGLLSMCGCGVWRIVTSSRGLATHAMGLIVMTACVIAYNFPDAFVR